MVTTTTSSSGPPHCGVQPPPHGVTANCVDPPTLTANNIAIHTVMIVFATTCLAIRLYTRHFILKGIRLDDYLCILGFCLLVTYSAMLLVCGNYYIGRHIWDITKPNFIYGHKLEVISEWIYCFVSPVLKLSVLWLYHGLFGLETRIHYVINASMSFTMIAYTALFFTSLLTCMPFERRYNPFVPGYCLPGGVTAYMSGAINVFTDAIVVCLPMPIIGKLNLARAQKFRVLAVFGLGIIVLALSITRLAKTPLVFKEKDPTWELSHFAIYSILELYFGLMCTCFLASPSFLDHFGPRVVRRIRSYTSSLRPSSAGTGSGSKSKEAGDSDNDATGPKVVPMAQTQRGEGGPADAGFEIADVGGLASPHRDGSGNPDVHGSLEQKQSNSSVRPLNSFYEV